MSDKGRKWGELAFEEKRKFYLGGTIAFFLLICFTFLMTPSPKVSDLTNFSLTLTREPSFKKQSLPASSYWVELYSDKGKYEIIKFYFLNSSKLISSGFLFKSHKTPKTSEMPTKALPKLVYFDWPCNLSL